MHSGEKVEGKGGQGTWEENDVTEKPVGVGIPSRGNITTITTQNTNLAVALPVNEESILVNFEQAIRLVVGIIFLFRPSIKHRALVNFIAH